MPEKLSLQEQIEAAVEMLPPAGETILFDEFKAKLYAANPNGGRDAFAFMLKNGLAKTTVQRQPDKSMKTFLQRPS
ncbi:MAG: hypothetical protein GC179_08700 [Anaerolineaceae bacterium]|nr:hypothetical protein [Anaerolineaceae bacterium]